MGRSEVCSGALLTLMLSLGAMVSGLTAEAAETINPIPNPIPNSTPNPTPDLTPIPNPTTRASPNPCSAAPAPLTDITPLMDAMLLALPGYLNRAIQRLGDAPGSLRTQAPPLTYVLVAGNPQVEPIQNPQPGGARLFQIFFTTLERQYINAELHQLQQFHQLVLAQVPEPEAWRLIRLRSQFAPYPANQRRLSPPRNSDDGPTAQAIRDWLQDRAARDTLSLRGRVCKDFTKMNGSP